MNCEKCGNEMMKITKLKPYIHLYGKKLSNGDYKAKPEDYEEYYVCRKCDSQK